MNIINKHKSCLEENLENIFKCERKEASSRLLSALLEFRVRTTDLIRTQHRCNTEMIIE